MPKRFRASEIWDDEWYQSLSCVEKLLWSYICDKCDFSGIYKINKKLIEFQIGSKVELDKFFKKCGSRLKIFDDKVCLTKFIQFQYGSSPSIKMRPRIESTLSSNGFSIDWKDLSIEYKYSIDTVSGVANTPMDKDMDMVMDMDKDMEEENEKSKSFKKPTVEQIQAYCTERQNKISPSGFFDFYESKGWLIGKEKMKDWKAAIRTWENKEKERTQYGSPKRESVAEHNKRVFDEVFKDLGIRDEPERVDCEIIPDSI